MKTPNVPPSGANPSESSPVEPADDARLRQARARLDHKRLIDPASLAQDGADALIEELRIHQVELELQNRELQDTNLKLAEARDWFEALFEGSPIPHVLLDRSLVVRHCNLAASDYFGLLRRLLIQRPLIPLLSAAVQSSGSYGGGLQAELFGSNAAGVISATIPMGQETREVQLRHRRMLYGDVDVALVAVYDVTEERRLQAHLRSARASAEAALTAKTQFLANISHELRSPLTSIIGYIDLVLAGVRPAAHPAMLRSARSAAMHLLGTVSDLLELSNIEAGGGIQLRPVPLELHGVARQAHEMLIPQAEAKGLRITLRVSGELPRVVLGDSLRIEQILVNLLTNAVKYTVEGSIELEVAYRQGNAVFVVRDTGVGIAKEDIERVFDPFERVDASDRRTSQGAGLGLALCRRLVHAMKGAIFVRSERGRGSEFTVQIPMVTMSDDAAPPLRVDPVQPRRRDRRVRVLVIDDMPEVAELLATCLEEANQEVVVCHRAIDALQVLELDRVDVIVLDMQMPEMDGFSFLAQLRARKLAVPVIATTARVSLEDRKRCLDAGCVGFIAKPIAVESFADVVLSHIPGF